MPVLILDGFTLTGRFPAQHGHPSFTFRYRPALPERVFEHYQKLGNSLTSREKIDAIASLLVEHVVDWDVLKQSPGRAPEKVDPGKPETYFKVPHVALDYMVQSVIGYQAWEKDGKNSSAESGPNSSSPDSGRAPTANAGSTTPTAAS